MEYVLLHVCPAGLSGCGKVALPQTYLRDSRRKFVLQLQLEREQAISEEAVELVLHLDLWSESVGNFKSALGKDIP